MTELDPTVAVPERARRRAFVVLVSLAVVASVAACSGDDSDTPGFTAGDDRSSTSSTSTLSTTATSLPSGSSVPTSPDDESVEDEIRVRYIGFWEARFEANSGTPDPDDPALAEFATGQQLETVIAETRQRRDQGLALRAAEPSLTEHSVTVVSIDADRAELQDCFVNDGVVYRVETGEIIDDAVVTRNVSAVLALVDGAWKLERATVVQEWEGIAGCALAD